MPKGCVIDTDVLSYLLRGDTRAEPFRVALVGRVPLVSFMTITKLDRWSVQRRWDPIAWSGSQLFSRGS